MSDETQQLFLNGINATSGEYLLPPLRPEEVATVARKQALDPSQVDPSHLKELEWRWRQLSEAHLGPMPGVDLKDLAQTGWAVIFPAGADPQVREKLLPLLEHRKQQATRRHAHSYRELSGELGYRPGETKQQYLARLGMGPGPVNPDKVPYYLLLVGSPEEIPYSFQYQLDVQYGVGRLHFDTLEEYACYARSVVEAETRGTPQARRAAFFGVRNPDDEATQLSAEHLVTPLAAKLNGHEGWQVHCVPAEETTKQRLSRLLGGEETPSLLFTASHGMGFPQGHERQRSSQGALLCQDWPGPKVHARKPIPPDFYFSGEDVGEEARLSGLIAFHFACYGAGTPQNDEFFRQAFRAPAPLARNPFLARLPQRLLGHERGALAVIGHVERAWASSFFWQRAGAQLAVFESTLRQLMEGYPVGAAMEFFNMRYAELSSDLSSTLEDVEFGKEVDPRELAFLWTANNDARNMVVLGDPAVRLSL